jgi:hypothetical protein
MNRSQLTEIQPIIDKTLGQLRIKYCHADRSIYRNLVTFYYGKDLEKTIDVSYDDLMEAKSSDLIPKQIKQII